MKRNVFFKGVLSLLIVISGGILASCSKQDDLEEALNPTEEPIVEIKLEPTIEPTVPVEDDPVLEEVVDLMSLDSINILVNKKHALPEDYVPSDLVKPNVHCMKDTILLKKEAALAIEEMFNAASDEGYSLSIGSAYRSYDYQKNLYNNYVKRDGEEAANRYSAKPGQSEHQTGLAVDLARKDGYCYLSNCFKDTDEGKWLKENAYLYGFILRYPEEKEEITGYIFEPWHYRYVGKEEALKIYQSGLTIEEYYDILD